MQAYFPLSWILVSVKWRLPAVTEDVAHIPVPVHTVLLLTSDLTNYQTHRKGTPQALPDPFITCAPPPSTMLYEKMPCLQKHLKYGQCFVFQLLCNFNIIIVFFLQQILRICLMMMTSTDRDDGRYSHRPFFFSSTFFFCGEQTNHLLSNDIQFTFIVVLGSGFFKTSLKSHPQLQMLWNS